MLFLVFLLSLSIIFSVTACSKHKKAKQEENVVNQNKSTLYQGEDATLSETPLSNTYKLLTTDKKLTIGYIGGSITEGSSAEKMSGSLQLSYVNRISNWFKGKYPEANIETVNSGVSDTGTNFGLFRLDRTLMNENGHDMPDLVFVEYTSNDWIYDTQSVDDLKSQIESLFLNIWKHNPYAEIVAVITIGDAESQNRQAYKLVCEHYGIPIIDVGVALRKKINEKIGTTNESDGNYYYTVDNLHPSHYGYDIYMPEIEKSFNSYLDGIKTESNNLYPYGKNLPDAQNTDLILTPKILEADKLTYSGIFKKIASPFTCKMYNTGLKHENLPLTENYLQANNRGMITAEFSGNTLGIMFLLNSNGIKMTYRIDGGASKTLKVDANNFGWQMYNHPQVFMLAHGLSDGEHTVQMSFSAIDGSNVMNVTVGGLLVNEE